ncbi:MAG: ATP-binding protein [Mariprofundaceae bacterium]
MKNTDLIRFLPIAFGVFMFIVAILLWPEATASSGGRALLEWVNIALIILLASVALHHGVRLIRERRERRPGSSLRSKLVIALVGMLLVPSLVLQFTSSQMVDRGLDVWFDTRVDTLLDRALDLARGFYARVETDLELGLSNYMNDPVLYQAMLAPANYSRLSDRLNKILQQEGWQRLQVYDINRRLLTGVDESGLSILRAEALGQHATLAVSLGRVVTELVKEGGREKAIGYAALRGKRGVIGILRAEFVIPTGVVQSARSIESDYSTYRQLERNRQSIKALFTDIMLIVTLLVVLISGWIALLFARKLTSPIGGLAQALQRITDGDLDVTVPVGSEDELGSLVKSFNRMAQRLKENYHALEESQQRQKQALQSSQDRQHILETLLVNLQTGVLLLDAQGKITLFNESLRKLLALPKGWLAGELVSPLCHGQLDPVGEFVDELCVQPEGHLQRELELTIDKQSFHVLIRGARLGLDEQAGMSGFLVVLDDVSSLAEAQKSRAWAEVASRLAHEIKNPLTPIKLAAERLQRRFRKQVDTPDVFDTCTITIVGQVERLQRLINDFSTMAHLPKPRLRETAIEEILGDMKHLYASYERVEVKMLSKPLFCLCDPDQIKQILINLLDNAVAATTDGSTVSLYASGHESSVEFHVLDQGEGFSLESQEHLFEPYFSTKKQGSGLGLSIAKRIAEDHGGELLLLSAAQPTEFCLRLYFQPRLMEET